MASLFASQRVSSQVASANCRESKCLFQIAQRPLPPVAATSCCPQHGRKTAGLESTWGVAERTPVRGQLQIAFGTSKASLYTQLPERLDEPTPGFDSIADALQDLAAGRISALVLHFSTAIST